MLTCGNRGERYSPGPRCRSKLRIVASRDGGKKWERLASIDETLKPGLRLHYHTLMVERCRLKPMFARKKYDVVGVYELLSVCDALSSFHTLLYIERLVSALEAEIRKALFQTLLPHSTCAATSWRWRGTSAAAARRRRISC